MRVGNCFPTLWQFLTVRHTPAIQLLEKNCIYTPKYVYKKFITALLIIAKSRNSQMSINRRKDKEVVVHIYDRK